MKISDKLSVLNVNRVKMKKKNVLLFNQNYSKKKKNKKKNHLESKLS